MYSRNYISDDTKGKTPPENYSGTALREDTELTVEREPLTEECGAVAKDDEAVFRGGPFSGLFDGGGLSRLFGGGIKSFVGNIGIEEIILIAAAAFLLFSKDGDKECAIMLLLLLAF